MIALFIEPRLNWGKKGGTTGKHARPFVDGFFISRTKSRKLYARRGNQVFIVSQEQENAKSVFNPVSSRVSFPLIEERVLAFWNDHDIVEKVDQVRKDAPLFTLYEGPPTANGTPGIHHVLARVFKDIIPRFKTMRGYRAVRKGGWDTHGLPVELEIEKELGTSSKREIEDLVPGDVQASIQRFNDLCRTSVMRYVQEWEDLTNRIAFWVAVSYTHLTLPTILLV